MPSIGSAIMKAMKNQNTHENKNNNQTDNRANNQNNNISNDAIILAKSQEVQTQNSNEQQGDSIEKSNNQLANRNSGIILPAFTLYTTIENIEDVTEEVRNKNQLPYYTPTPAIEGGSSQDIENSSNSIHNSEPSLHTAARANNLDAIRNLLQFNKSIVDEKNKKGQTALHITMQNNNREIAIVLVQAGASPFIFDDQQQSPCKLALDNNNTKIIGDVLTVIQNKSNEPSLPASSSDHQSNWKKTPTSFASSINHSKTFGNDIINNNSEGANKLEADEDIASSFVNLSSSK